MTGTQLYAVRSWIATSLDALPAFTGVLVTPTWKTGSKAAQRCYSRQGRFEHAPAGMHAGPIPRNEVGTFEQVIYVEGIGQSLDKTIQTAVTLGAAFETWLAANRSPGAALPGVQYVEDEGPGGLDDRFNDMGSLAILSYTVRFTARI